jgi:hypothetical protein
MATIRMRIDDAVAIDQATPDGIPIDGPDPDDQVLELDGAGYALEVEVSERQAWDLTRSLRSGRPGVIAYFPKPAGGGVEEDGTLQERESAT